MELAITNRTLDAAQALEWGLITRVVADETLREEAACFAAELADGPLEALGRDQTAATPGVARVAGVSDDARTPGDRSLGRRRGRARGDRSLP
jgi:2-(1,2-epoxy-1,2-dihydrophenyl)acetyl-CoA isomerase